MTKVPWRSCWTLVTSSWLWTSREGRWSCTGRTYQARQGQRQPYHGHMFQASHRHSSPHCQQCRSQLHSQPLRANRCPSVCVIPLQIITPSTVALYLTFQSALITPPLTVCKAGSSLVNRDPVTRVKTQIIACLFSFSSLLEQQPSHLLFSCIFIITLWKQSGRQTHTYSHWTEEGMGEQGRDSSMILSASTGMCLPWSGSHFTYFS